ncbi:hypothetical protein G6F63_015150 [Rhizopus arrhizus]|nr:hypothetical protein G6F63_015150 [Rhizopus arrhizus]
MAVPVEDIGNRRVITRQAPVGEGGPALFVARGADAEHQFMLAAQQREDLALPYAQIHAVQDVRFPVPGLQARDFQCRGAHACAP